MTSVLSSSVRLAAAVSLAALVAGTAFAQAAAAPAPADTKPIQLAAADVDEAAAQSPAVTADAGGEIVVTANKRAESIQRVPTAITALGQDVFTVQGIGRSANEVLNLVPNASAGTQQHGRPRWWIRGVGAGQQQIDLSNPVGFYLDEVYISNASATGIPLFDIERVEVLRGPQGTLWGKNTTGGAIGVITKRPSLSDRDDDNYVKVDYGSYDDKLVEGGVNVPLSDKVAGRIAFHLEDRDGRYYNLFTDKHDSAVQDGVLRAQLLARPTDSFEALLSVHYRKYKTDGGYWTVGSYAANGVYRNGYAPPTDHDQVNTNAEDFTDSDQVGGALHLNWDFGALTLTSITGYERWEATAANDSDYTPLEISRGYTDARSRQWTQELRLASPKSDRFNWILGAYYFNEDIASLAASATLPQSAVPAQQLAAAPAVAFAQTLYDHKAESGAAFGSATYAFTDALKLTVGARYTRETKTLDFTRQALPNAAAARWSNYARWWDSYTGTFGGPGTFGNDFKRTWGAFTYDITPAWQIDRNNLLYAKFSHGLKSGGFNTAATLPAALTVVDPEKLDAYELGYKSTWFDGRLTFNATLFHYGYDDVQVNVVGPNPGAVGGATVSYLQNAAKAHTEGAEFEVTARPFDRLVLSGAVGLLKTNYDRLQVINGGADLSGANFVRAPKVTVNLAGTYTIPLPGDAAIELEADGRYQSLQYYYITPQDTTNRNLLDQPGYTLANARISYVWPDGRYRLSFYVNNLFDADYRNHALPQANAATGVTGDTIQWGDPRTYGASFVARF